MHDLSSVTTDALRAELRRREETATGRPKQARRYATKADWAEARLAEHRAQLAMVHAQYYPGPNGLYAKQDAVDAITEEVRKFERMAAAYRRRGE